MKAMILAAGFGTRLQPYTRTTPKALFPIGDRPILDRTICGLITAGCSEIMINTHHLADQIHAFLSRQFYGIPISTRFEEIPLGTGGGIKNVMDFWDDRPFIVINSDIVTDIDLSALYRFHLDHPHPVTLALYDDENFNTVITDPDGYVVFFDTQRQFPPIAGRRLTFTGIQVINPDILDMIPVNRFSNIIDTYQALLSEGKKITTVEFTNTCYWKDIGTPVQYRQAAYDLMSAEAFVRAFPGNPPEKIERLPLFGDGSDRKWYRLKSGDRTLIMVDHGIRSSSNTAEVDAFIRIGSHLRQKNIPVPAMVHYDAFSGLVFMDDLGDTHLQTVILGLKDRDAVVEIYQSIIQLLIHMSQSACCDFDPAWTYQTAAYDKALILDRECRYFIDAFLNRYLNRKDIFDDFLEEFSRIAGRALDGSVEGFMHRDFQSRNIMVKDNGFYFIDFQGGRIGPLQYDLASLLIDPYVALPYDLQDQLVDVAVRHLSSHPSISPVDFRRAYRYCAVARNFQILGAFGFLTRVSKKPHFESYIPQALRNLKHHFSRLPAGDFPKLKTLIDSLPGA